MARTMDLFWKLLILGAVLLAAGLVLFALFGEGGISNIVQTGPAGPTGP